MTHHFLSDLQKRGRLVPLFALCALPRAEKGETDLSALVQVRVEADDAAAGRPKIDLKKKSKTF